MVEQKGCQQYKTEGKLQCHSRLPWRHGFWFLAGFNSIYPPEKMIQG